jgi:hypothetical protein
MSRMRAVLVTHTHWDREWYRTFQAFRARLVDAVDRVLDLADADPGFRFLLDGQTVALEDYAEVRPGRLPRLQELAREGRLALGPWYVQPDSLLPSGEAHVRNLLLGRAVGEAHGPVSRVGYTPDSFGHPAQFPQLLAGFGIDVFVYWRGHGDEIDRLDPEWWWEAPDGTRVLACHLGRGYFNAQTAPGAPLEDAARGVARTAKDLVATTRSGVVLLMNGIDHALPDPRTQGLADALGEALGFPVERGLLEDFVGRVRSAESLADAPAFAGELVGARMAPLLPGVWSTRTWIKLRNRACEAALEGHAEPLAALAVLAGLADERPSLDLAWKALLKNQAHDSICGCSRDEVHTQMRPRFDEAFELAEETAGRVLERVVGLGPERRPPWSAEADVAVWNPSPRGRTDVVRFPFDPHPWAVPARRAADAVHPTLLHDLTGARFEVDGRPARLVPGPAGRVMLIPGREAWDLEFVAHDVPALGWRRLPVRRLEGEDDDAPEEVAPGGADARIETDEVAVAVRADGTLDVELPGGLVLSGVGALEDTGDRGDSYDFDPVVDVEDDAPPVGAGPVRVLRDRHPSGIHRLLVERVVHVPAGLDAGRERRSAERVPLAVAVEARVAAGVARVDLRVVLDHHARDHRLRFLVPVPSLEDACAATTFDVAPRRPGAPEGTGWVQAPVATFPQQGFVHAGGVTVAAPGLAEAELLERPLPAVALTMLRAVGDLSRHDLHSRPGLAGPGTRTPGAQCPGRLEARLSLLPGCAPAAAREAELGLRAAWCGEAVRAPQDTPLLALEPEGLLLTAFKPAMDGDGVILRILNPDDAPSDAVVRLGFDVESARAVRLDEGPAEESVLLDGRRTLRLLIPPHALRSVRLVGALRPD